MPAAVGASTRLDKAAVALFATVYLRTWNATEAYLATHPGVERSSAAQGGYEWVHHPQVQPFIQQHYADAWKACAGNLDELLGRLWLIVRADPAEAYDDETGELLPLRHWPVGLRAALEAYDGDAKTFRLASRIHAVRTLLEQLKEIGGANDIAGWIAAVTQRGDQLRASLAGAS